jgi:hypothetical protein
MTSLTLKQYKYVSYTNINTVGRRHDEWIKKKLS